jgi:hypothetical protein
MYMGYDGTADVGYIQASKSGSYQPISLQPRGGAVGIGTAAPGYPLDVNGTGRFTGIVNINGTVAGNARNIFFQTSGSNRWFVGPSFDTETGSNIGSNLHIQRFNNAGAFVGTPLSINRSTGYVTFESGMVYGGVQLSNSVTGTGSMVLNTSPVFATDAIISSNTYPKLILDSTASGQWKSSVVFRNSSVNKWEIGTDISSDGGDNLYFYDNTNSSERGFFNGNGLMIRGVSAQLGLGISSSNIAKYISFKPETAANTAEIGYWTGSAFGILEVPGSLRYGGVTLNGSVTGTGSMVLGTAPAITNSLRINGISNADSLAVYNSEQTKYVTVKPETAANTAQIGYWTGSAFGILEVSGSLRYGGVTLNGSVTGTGKMVLSDTPTFDGGIVETYASVSISSNVLTIDLSSATVFNVTVNANINTFTINNAASSKAQAFTLFLKGNGTAYIQTWGASVKWPNGGTAPTLTSTLNKTDIITFVTNNGGTTWFGFVGGQNF